MISERENALRIYSGKESPEYIPTSMSCYKTVMPSCMYERPAGFKDGYDWFGVYWAWDEKTKGYTADPRKAYVVPDIAHWKDTVKFPDLGSIDWDAAAKKDLEGFDKNSKLLRIFLESGPFERLHSLTGFEEAFISMYEEPEAFHELMEAITDFRVEEIRHIGKAYHPDVILNMDDLASATAPFFSLEMYREFIKPYEKRIADAIHENGAYFLYHSCGRMQCFIDDLLEIGVDAFNALTPCNDQEEIMKKYGSRIVVDGGMDSILISTEGVSEEELRCEMRRACDIFGPYQRFIVHPAALIPRNREILLDEAEKYGHQFYCT